MTPIGRTHTAVLLLSLGSLSACSQGSDRASDSSAAGAKAAASAGHDSTPAGAPMAGMPMHADTMAKQVETHLQRLGTTNADSLKSLVAADRAVVTALIADCEQMMKEMKMTPPAKWHDAVKALRQDLDRMAGASGPALAAAMPAHRQRIADMLAMRRDMMHM